MPARKVSDGVLLDLCGRLGNGPAIAQVAGISIRALMKRLAVMRERGVYVPPLLGAKADPQRASKHKARINVRLENGIVIIGSDAHVWPGTRTPAQLAFIKMIKDLRPKMVIANGDIFDGARISRHPRIGFLERAPEVEEELSAVKGFLGEVMDVTPRGCRTIWTLGNHDNRYEAELAAKAQAYEGIKGFHLKDHFPEWEPCWSVHINPFTRGYTVVKHSWHNGSAAKRNNVVKGGTHMVTGHLHSLGEERWTNYWGDWYGIDCGTMADPKGPQFVHYTEDNSLNWRAGFSVLTFHKGRLLQPEFVQVFDDSAVEFRGQVIKL